jgi:hypothetical protein
MMALTPDIAGVPPHGWSTGVADVDAVVAKAKTLGGRRSWSLERGRGGRIAILKDPSGAAFSIIKGDPGSKRGFLASGGAPGAARLFRWRPGRAPGG